MIKNDLEKILKLPLSATDNPDFGDYSSNIALHGKDSKAEAGKIVEKLRKDKKLSEIVEKIDIAGPGFINFWLKKDVLIDNMMQIGGQGEDYGRSDLLKGKKIMFEFAHPNTHKAFHLGHLRNITTGEALSRISEFAGAQVIRVNYQGDVGLHIAKALWGINKLGFKDPGDIKSRAEFLGKAYSRGATSYEEDEQAKTEIEKINDKIYNKSDDAVNKLYEETRKLSLDYFEKIYERVYTKFDRLYFESEVAEKGKEIAGRALKKNILRKSEGAVIFPGSEYGFHDRVFISSKEIPTYEAKDLGLAELQFAEYDPDRLIHVVGPEQTAYFQVLFKAMELIMPGVSSREVHVPYGWVRLKEGKMSSRTGNVVLGEWLLDEAKSSIKKSYNPPDDVAEQIAVGAVKYSFLKCGLTQDIAFDLKESIALEGNSGPYLQYTVARTNSVAAKAKGVGRGSGGGELDDQELLLLRSLTKFEETVTESALNYSPNILCNYLYDLAQKFNTFYNKDKIIGGENEEFRLSLTSATGQVLRNGLGILGIDTPERM